LFSVCAYDLFSFDSTSSHRVFTALQLRTVVAPPLIGVKCRVVVFRVVVSGVVLVVSCVVWVCVCRVLYVVCECVWTV